MGFHGKKHTLSHKRKMSKMRSGKGNPMHGKTGEKDPAWKGGKKGYLANLVNKEPLF